MDPFAHRGKVNTILVTNTRACPNGASIAADIAQMFASKGTRVVLIDADLHRPLLHKHFGLPKGLGLSDLLNTHRSPLSMLNHRENGKLAILTGGNDTGSNFKLFRSEKFRNHLQILKNEFDQVIIQGPPFFYSETLDLAIMVDRVVLLIHPAYNKTKTSQAIIGKFQRTGAALFGIAMREQSHNQAFQDFTEKRGSVLHERNDFLELI